MRFKNPYSIGKKVSAWLTAFYAFWIAFIVALVVATRFRIELGIMFLIFLLIGLSLLTVLLLVFRRQIGTLTRYKLKTTLIIVLPIAYWWIGSNINKSI
ncbi:hypothetical protein [[Mycoplasma] testudinis]|uniref:hypothetical protein n=1 Tax=[Mycoplasma] testudinis TaxID=33924 RepID=UPI00047FA0EA|nr:hypothetical protein [[Mycoplasma] testudinis]